MEANFIFVKLNDDVYLIENFPGYLMVNKAATNVVHQKLIAGKGVSYDASGGWWLCFPAEMGVVPQFYSHEDPLNG